MPLHNLSIELPVLREREREREREKHVDRQTKREKESERLTKVTKSYLVRTP